MTAKKGRVSLAAMLAKSVAEEESARAAAEALVEPTPEAGLPVPASTSATPEAGKPVSFFITEADRARLKKIAIDEGLSLNSILHQATSQWLNAKGYKGLDAQTANRPSGLKRARG